MRGSPKTGARKAPPPFTAEHRANLCAARARRVFSVETCAKISAAQKGRVVSQDTRDLISATLTGRPGPKRSPETRARISAGRLGKPQSPEHTAKSAASRRGMTQSAETIAKRAAKAIGRRHTPETRARMSEIAIAQSEAGRQRVNKFCSYTTLAQALHRYLSSRGFTVEPEVRFGRYTVDLYDREHHVAYEADGTYWHQKAEKRRPGCDARRDAYLYERHGLPVMRYTDTEIRYLQV